LDRPFAHREVLAASVSGVEVTLNHHAHACRLLVHTIKKQFKWLRSKANVKIHASDHGARRDHGGA
jgi:hypothetical protein